MRAWTVLIAFAALTSACVLDVRYEEGSGVVVQEARPISSFDVVSFNGVGEVVIRQGDAVRLEVQAEDNVLPHLVTEVRGDALQISFDTERWSNFIRPTEPIRFAVTTPSLTGLKLAGLGDIQVLALNGERLDVALSGAGRIALAGTVDEQVVNVSGAGTYDAGGLASHRATVNMSGAGRATLWVQEALDVNISGVGSVGYYGAPRVRQSITGLGSLKPLGGR